MANHNKRAVRDEHNEALRVLHENFETVSGYANYRRRRALDDRDDEETHLETDSEMSLDQLFPA